MQRKDGGAIVSFCNMCMGSVESTWLPCPLQLAPPLPQCWSSWMSGPQNLWKRSAHQSSPQCVWCCAMPCCAVLCCAMLRAPCCAGLRCPALCPAMLWLASGLGEGLMLCSPSTKLERTAFAACCSVLHCSAPCRLQFPVPCSVTAGMLFSALAIYDSHVPPPRPPPPPGHQDLCERRVGGHSS